MANTTPVLSGATASTAINDELIANFTTSPFSTFVITDPEAAGATPTQTLTVTVALDTAAKGTLSGAGFVLVSPGVYSFTGLAAAANTAINGLVFTPTPNRLAVGFTETTTFTVNVNDNSNDNGIASNSATTVITTSINNPAILSGGLVGQAINDNATAGLSPFTAYTIFDIDVGINPGTAQSQTLTVGLSNPLSGSFTAASLGGGSYNSTTGVYTFVGTAATAQAAIRGLVFVPTNNFAIVGTTTTNTFTVALADINGNTATSPVSATVVSTSVNDTPTLGGAVAAQAIGDNATLSPFSAFTIADVDLAQAATTTTISFNAANGAFSVGGTGTITAGGYSFTGTAAQAQAAIRALVFTPTNNLVAVGQTNTTAFTVVVNDQAPNGSVSNIVTTVVATAINDTPILTVPGPLATQTVNDSVGATGMPPFTTVTITDADSTALSASPQAETVTVTLSSAANGSLTNLGTGAYNATTGVYTFTGTAFAAQAAIQALKFVPAANIAAVGATTTTTFTISVNDGALTVTNGTATVVSTSIDNAAVLSAGVVGQAINDNATAGLSPFATYTITDVDLNQSQALSVTLNTPANGLFTAASLGGGAYDAGTGVYTFTGTAVAAQAAIRGLVFVPTNNLTPVLPTTSSFTVVFGGVTSATNATVISTSVNDLPVLGGAVANQPVNDNIGAGGMTPFALFTIADADSTATSVLAQTETVTVTLSTAANGTLTGGAGTYNAATGVYTLTGAASAVAAQADIRSLVFVPTDSLAAAGQSTTTTFTVKVTDQVGGITSNALTTVVSAAVNQAPAIAGTAAGAALVIAVDDNVGATGTSPFAGVTVTDADSTATSAVPQAVTLTVTLSTAAGGLSAAANGTLTNLGTGTYNATTGIYSITGTAPQVQAAIQALKFVPTANIAIVGTATSTTFTISVNDNIAIATTNTNVSVSSTSMNDASVLPAAATTVQTIADTATVSPFTTYTITDVDPSQAQTTTVSFTTGNGTLAGGGFGAAVIVGANNTYSFTGTAAQAQVAIRALVFTPQANQVTVGQATTTTFAVSVVDNLAATTTTQANAATVVATSVNNVPTVGGAVANQTVNDNVDVLVGMTPFTAFTIADTDQPQATTVTITLDAAAKGTLIGAGTGVNGVYTFTAVNAGAAQTAIQAVKFVPTANRVAVGLTETTTLTVSVSDGVAPAVVNATTTVVSTSINNAPTATTALTTNLAVSLTILDTATATPFTTFTVADVDPNQVQTVTVTLSTAANGALSNLGSGTYNPLSGIYSFTGTAAAATTAIQALVFTPTQNLAVVGGNTATTFAVNVTDGAGAIATANAQTTVTATSVNNAPTLAPIVITTGLTDTAFVDSPFADITGTLVGKDVDLTTTLTYGITGVATAATVSATNTYGTLTVNTTTGAYTFVANAAAIEPLTAATSATFTVTVSDGTLTSTQPLTIAITQSGVTESNGNDVLAGAAGANTWAGLAGNDVYYVDVTADSITEAVGGGNDIVYSTASDYTLGANIESLVVWGTGVNGTGNDTVNYLFGNALNNTLDGKGGADGMMGGAGDDIYLVDDIGDTVTENLNQGFDAVNFVATTGTYTLGANVEILRLIGVVGTEALNGTGNELANQMFGNAGNNALDGKAGADAMAGAAGDDTYTVDNIGDLVIEQANEGTDIVLSSISYTIGANVENLTLVAGTVATDAFGNSLNNTLIGNSNNNIMSGGAGTDTMTGGTGNDTYYVDVSTDVITELAGEGTADIAYSTATNYTLANNVENLVVWGAGVNGTGNAGNNYIFGNPFGGSAINNILSGDAGNDILMGFDGADTYNGGTGADIYNLSEQVASSDTIRVMSVVNESPATIGLFDKATSFALGTGTVSTAGVDMLDLDTTTIAANLALFNGTDSGLIQTNSVLNGIISFQGAGGIAIAASSLNLADALTYVQTNIIGNNTVAFVAGTDTYVFQDGGANDVVVNLVGVSATSVNNSGLGAGAVWIV